MHNSSPQPRTQPDVEPQGSLKDAHGRGAATFSLSSAESVASVGAHEPASILGGALAAVASPVRGGAPQGPDAAISGPLPSASTASAVDCSALSRQVTRPADAGRVFLYRLAGVKVRPDVPSVSELLAAGWTAHGQDPRYKSTWMFMEVEE